MGTLDSYYDANMDLISVNPRFNLYDSEWRALTISSDFTYREYAQVV